MKTRFGVCVWASVLAMFAAGCSDGGGDEGDKCASVLCPANTTCNPQTGACDPNDTDKCANANCPANTTCNSQTGACDPNDTDKCANANCPENTTCNPQTGACDPDDTDKCANANCPANTTCNPQTGACDPDDTDKCANANCPANTTCNPQTGACDPNSTDKCANKSCPTDTKCNAQTGACDPVQQLDECSDDKDCNENWEVCQNGSCVNKACVGVTCNDWEFCGITGKCVPWAGNCNTDDDCDGDTCNTATHTCGISCEDEPEENIVPNWSFEETNGGAFNAWSLENSSDYAYGRVEISDDAHACNTSANLINTSTSNARLVSDMIHLPEVDFTGGNEKFGCTVYIKGKGTISVGYRTEKADKPGKFDYYYTHKGKAVDNSDFTAYAFEMGLPVNTRETQVIVAAHSTTQSGILVDAFTCERKTNKCTGKTCAEDWQICSITAQDKVTKEYGACVARDGFCDADKDCSIVETCDTTTHLCKAVEGKCSKHADCADGALKFCDSKTHTCIDGDPCEGVTCDEWKQCDARTGTCELKDGRCVRSRDCLKDKPACYAATHTCVDTDSVYSIAKRQNCPIADDYFNYLNYEEEDPKKPLLNDSLVCPVNIVPNGSFEDWVEFQYTETSDVHVIPDWWYTNEDYNNYSLATNRYLSKIPFESIILDETNVHSGDASLRIAYTTQPAVRLSSWGFDVPGGSYDCAYWVRGKGDVRMHLYSSRGDAKATDFVSYDTTEWVRVPFTIKEAASAARIIFYVSNSDASKDHIQIDDVACTKYSN